MATEKPTASAQAVYDVLCSIDASLRRLVDHFGAGARAAAPATNVQAPPEIASDADLDGQHGDPEVKAKDPRDWTGDSMRGRRFSECPPEYLDMVADRLVFFSSKAEDPKKARYDLLDAARARGWARRLRAGYVVQEPEGIAPPPDGALTDDDIPF